MALGLNNLIFLSNLSAASETYSDTMQTLYGQGFAVQILVLGILMPTCEELVYRGLVYKRLQRISCQWLERSSNGSTGCSKIRCVSEFQQCYVHLLHQVFMLWFRDWTQIQLKIIAKTRGSYQTTPFVIIRYLIIWRFKKKFLFTNLKNRRIVGKNKKCKKGLRYYERATATEKCWLVSSFVWTR